MINERIIYQSKRIATVIIISGLLLAIAGCLLLLYTDRNLVGWCFVIFSVFFLIFGIASLFDRKPYIIIKNTGITDMSVIREEIEWEAILQADDFLYRGQYFVRLLVDRKYKPHLIQPTWFYRLDRIYGKDGVKALFIRTNFLDISAVELAGVIQSMIGRVKD